MDNTETRAQRRARDRAERDRNRRNRQLALSTFAAMVGRDETISGMTMISPTGEVEYIDATHLRTGGRA